MFFLTVAYTSENLAHLDVALTSPSDKYALPERVHVDGSENSILPENIDLIPLTLDDSVECPPAIGAAGAPPVPPPPPAPPPAGADGAGDAGPVPGVVGPVPPVDPGVPVGAVDALVDEPVDLVLPTSPSTYLVKSVIDLFLERISSLFSSVIVYSQSFNAMLILSSF